MLSGYRQPLVTTSLHHGHKSLSLEVIVGNLAARIPAFLLVLLWEAEMGIKP